MHCTNCGSHLLPNVVLECALIHRQNGSIVIHRATERRVEHASPSSHGGVVVLHGLLLLLLLLVGKATATSTTPTPAATATGGTATPTSSTATRTYM